MTGQAATNVAVIRDLASRGMTAEAVAVEMGLNRSYVLVLAKQNHINIALQPSKFDQRRADFKRLAVEGRHAGEIAEALGLPIKAVRAMCAKQRVKLARKPHSNRRGPQIRDAHMAALYKSGKTLVQIGEMYGVTRERVRQLLTRYHGLTAKDGGEKVVATARAAERKRRKDEASFARWGCSFAEYRRIKSQPKKPTYAYKQQRANARQRAIGWELTLAQWWGIWESSGRWSERGRGQGYCMCRKGDIGPYAIGNVFIAPSRLNSSEQARKKSGLPTGVKRTKNGAAFEAYRSVNGRKFRLGTYATPDLAHAAYLGCVNLNAERAG